MLLHPKNPKQDSNIIIFNVFIVFSLKMLPNGRSSALRGCELRNRVFSVITKFLAKCERELTKNSLFLVTAVGGSAYLVSCLSLSKIAFINLSPFLFVQYIFFPIPITMRLSVLFSGCKSYSAFAPKLADERIVL